ncbi:MAG: hypothetical protein B7733_16370 [Myxococcales bacterium FL481]|nr:MAG: hypothetical protein B7733_16370 [Myxococcales bacterium FL481]
MRRATIPSDRWIFAAGLAALVAVSVWIREPGFTQGGFGSHDVGGILYNAMVLVRGGLPYVDTVEYKAPGSFYLAAAGFAGPEGRDIARLQVCANLWGIAGLIGLTAFARRLWTTRAALTAGAIYCLYDAFLDSLDGNYVTWAALPQLLAMFTGYEAAVRTRGRRWWLLAGVLLGLATLCKRPAGVGLLVLLGWAWTRARAPGVVAVVAGFVVAHVPISLHYLAHEHLADLWLGYLFNPWAPAYVGARDHPIALELWEGTLATTHVLTIPLALAAFAWFGRDRNAAWLRAWLVGALLSAFVGFRFYKGYYLPVAAPIALLAAAPWGLLGAGWPRRRAWRVAASLVLVTLVVRQIYWIDHVRDSRSRPRDQGARIIATHVTTHTEPEDRIWIWGWHLWGVYALADRMSGSRVYKSLGLLTPPNDNTWRRPGTKTRFIPGPAAELVLEDLERTRPAYLVFGSTVPHREFTELKAFLRHHGYRRDRRVRLGRVQFWRRYPTASP